MADREIRESMIVRGRQVEIRGRRGGDDYISLTDLAREKSDSPKVVIANWMRNRETIELLGLWEQMNNPDFKGLEFESFKNQSGRNAFVMTPTKWIEATGAIGVVNKRGRYGAGTFACLDIALDFAAWISPEFRLYVFQEYKRLKRDETSRLNERWNEHRLFASLNYRLHTDAVKDAMPPQLSAKDQRFVYADEADVLNLAVFGLTAAQWRHEHPDAKGNIRDNATLVHNLVLSNLESLNAVLLGEHKSKAERAMMLNEVARKQMRTFASEPGVARLEGADD